MVVVGMGGCHEQTPARERIGKRVERTFLGGVTGAGVQLRVAAIGAWASRASMGVSNTPKLLCAARNVRRSAAHEGLQPVRHPNARLHDLWRDRGAVDRVEHVADERP